MEKHPGQQRACNFFSITRIIKSCLTNKIGFNVINYWRFKKGYLNKKFMQSIY